MIAMQVDRRNKLTPWTHGGVESVCVCVCERERERERKEENGREMGEKERTREKVCVCECESERERLCERETVRLDCLAVLLLKYSFGSNPDRQKMCLNFLD